MVTGDKFLERRNLFAMGYLVRAIRRTTKKHYMMGDGDLALKFAKLLFISNQIMLVSIFISIHYICNYKVNALLVEGKYKVVDSKNSSK